MNTFISKNYFNKFLKANNMKESCVTQLFINAKSHISGFIATVQNAYIHPYAYCCFLVQPSEGACFSFDPPYQTVHQLTS